MDLGFTLAKDETLIRKVNRHWIALVPVVAAASASLLVAIGMTYLFGRYRSSFPGSMTGAGLIVFDIFMLAFALAILYAGYWIWKRNFLVLTNQHLVRVEQKGLFAHSVSQLALARVQDVSGVVSGFFATIFGYGNLTVETAGAEDNFVFNTISVPSDVASACLKAHEDCLAANAATKPPVVEAAPPHEMPIPPVSMPAPEPIMVPEPLPTPPVAPEPEPEPEPEGPIPLTESVTASIEHRDQ